MIGCDDDHCPMRQVGHTRRDNNPLRFIEVSATLSSQDTLMQKGAIFHRILIAVGSCENPLHHIAPFLEWREGRRFHDATNGPCFGSSLDCWDKDGTAYETAVFSP